MMKGLIQKVKQQVCLIYVKDYMIIIPSVKECNAAPVRSASLSQHGGCPTVRREGTHSRIGMREENSPKTGSWRIKVALCPRTWSQRLVWKSPVDKLHKSTQGASATGNIQNWNHWVSHCAIHHTSTSFNKERHGVCLCQSMEGNASTLILTIIYLKSVMVYWLALG